MFPSSNHVIPFRLILVLPPSFVSAAHPQIGSDSSGQPAKL